MFYKQYRTLKVNELLTVKSVTLSGQLWQAFTYGVPDLFEPESAKPYLSHVEFLPFLHKFNTFTFYTPYLLFLDQLQNEGKRVFSIRFQNQYIRGVYCQYPIFICFSTKR